MFYILLVSLLALLATAGIAAGYPDAARVPTTDPNMARAVAEARATFQDFLTLHLHPAPTMTRFAVKIGIDGGKGREFIWLNPFIVEEDVLRGQLANDPTIVEGLRKGQVVEVSTDNVVDWMYVDDGVMHGNFTGCVLVAHAGPQAVAAFRKDYGRDCRAP